MHCLGNKLAAVVIRRLVGWQLA